MRRNKKNNINQINEQDSIKYDLANQQFKHMIEKNPDIKKMEPIEIYNWIKKMVDLTKI